MNGDADLTRAMRRWVALLERGYSIRPTLARSGFRRTEWRGTLFNPEGAFVQNVRRDTVQKLMQMGLIGPKEKTNGDHTGIESPERGD